MKGSNNLVPDAILNLTKCVLVFPGLNASESKGIATCRLSHDSWEKPQLVTYVPNRIAPAKTGDLLIFVLNPAAERRLKGGVLPLDAHSSGSGVTLQQMVSVTDAELNRDALVYTRNAGRLTGATVAGPVRLVVDADSRSRSEITSDEQRLLEAMTSYFNSIMPIGIIVHHSSVLPAQQNVPNSVSAVDDYHATKGFDILCMGRRYHVAYHYLILEDGKVQAGRPELCQGAHSRGYNAYLGISLAGDFSSVDNPRGQRGIRQPTAKQMTALLALCRRLMTRYHIPFQRVLRHSDVARTLCPGDRFPFRQLLQQLQ
jgi:hypothetical protein